MNVLKFSELRDMGMPFLKKGAEELGFKKAKEIKYGYEKEITPTVEYVLGFSTGKPWPGHCFINPGIGIKQKGISALFKEITGVESYEAIVSRSLGYFTPKNSYIEWDLGAGDIKEITDDLCLTVKNYGIPSLEKLIDLRDFAEAFRKHGFFARHQLPVIYYKLGEYDKCLEYMQESLALLDTKPFLFRLPVDYHWFYDKMTTLIEVAKKTNRA